MTIPRDHIQSMAAYALADLSTSASGDIISLSQNESFRPPSPNVGEAVKSALSQSMLYPDPDWRDLRNALADVHAIQSVRILCGNGSLDLIGAIARVYSGPKRSVLVSEHAYPFFRTAGALSDARVDKAPEVDATVSVSAMIDAVRPDTGLVFIANPGNPTGTRLSKKDLVRLREGLRDDILLVIDEAYGEFADHLGERCFDMVEGGNTILLRTFSKAYGMAGYRVGWGLFPDLIQCEIRKVLNPNNVSSLSQVAALAALRDQRYMRETCDMTIEIRDRIAADLKSAGFKVYPSFTNFLLIDCETEAKADDLDQRLRDEGILLRKQVGAGLPGMVRMTVGTAEAVNIAVDWMIKWRAISCR
ncbi:MAG: histidinol-phosphate transaminase [Pseudomonadota bacterium]